MLHLSMPPGPSSATMRIYALPLCRARADRPALVYYLASLPPKRKTKPESRTTVLAKRGLQKLTETWNKWGAMEGGWQARSFVYLGSFAAAQLLLIKTLNDA